MKILLATSNLHKIREFRQLLKPLKKLELYSLNNFPNLVLPEETGTTFEENSSIKALFAAKETGMMSIGDDSGLVVPVLEGRPGLYSARYAGQGATDRENRLKLLSELEDIPEADRGAFFECVLTLASQDGVIKTFHGRVEGNILSEEKGGQGFGYDSLFCKEGYSQTFAELSEETKNKISHRAKAVDKLLLFLEGFSG